MFIPWAKTPYGEFIVQGYIDIAQINYELLVRELEGLADGADLTFLEVFLMCYQMEISALIGDKAVWKEPDECTDVYISDPKNRQAAICHNEDTYPLVKKDGYFVTAHIVDTVLDNAGKPQRTEEKFTHFAYPGLLPGNAFGFNSHGVIQTVNALYPKEVIVNKTGRYILSRALLGAKNIDDVKMTLYNEGYGAAYGVNFNFGFLPNAANQLSEPEIWNIEVAPNSQQNHSLLDIKEIDSNYYHVNSYRRMNVVEQANKTVSSAHRSARIEQLNTPLTVQDLLTILGDTQDPDFPIYRTPRPSDPESTVATAVFDLHKRTLQVYKDNPSNSSYGPVMTLPIATD